MLIIDDAFDTCTLLKEYFEGIGYQVKLAFDGQEGLDLMEEYRANIILMDVMMPFMNGEECLKRLKLRYAGTPVIVVTSQKSIDSVEKFAEMGADGYIAKPVNLGVLREQVKQTLRR